MVVVIRGPTNKDLKKDFSPTIGHSTLAESTRASSFVTQVIWGNPESKAKGHGRSSSHK